jgi:hypothetical protein
MRYVIASLIVLLLVACNAPEVAPTPQVTEPPATTAILAATETATTAPAALTFEAAVYVDSESRFQLSYPAGWMLDASQGGSRGSYVQITSWQHEAGGFNEIPADGSVVQIAIYQWDPIGDHAARLEMRRNNFLSSGTLILEENDIVFPNGQTGTRLLLQDTDGKLSVVMLTVLGSEYLEISGYGPDVQLMDEIIATFEFTS